MHLKKLYDWGAPRNRWVREEEARAKPLVAPQGVTISAQINTRRDRDGGVVVVEPIVPPVKAVKVLSAPDRQNFSTRMVVQGTDAGWMTLALDGERASQIIIKTDKGDLVYNVLRGPGRYCCHCGDKLPDDDFTNQHAPGAAAKQHVADVHGDAPSPNQDEPSGYECLRYYECERAPMPADAQAGAAA